MKTGSHNLWKVVGDNPELAVLVILAMLWAMFEIAALITVHHVIG